MFEKPVHPFVSAINRDLEYKSFMVPGDNMIYKYNPICPQIKILKKAASFTDSL
jgi:hypothetical protein